MTRIIVDLDKLQGVLNDVGEIPSKYGIGILLKLNDIATTSKVYKEPEISQQEDKVV